MTNDEEDRIKKIRKLLDSEAETRSETPIEPPKEDSPYEGTTRASVPGRTPPQSKPEKDRRPPIALDKDNMPLPRRVNQVDMEGTRVSPTIHGSASRPRHTPSKPANASAARPSQPPLKRPVISLEWLSKSGGCFTRAFVFSLFGLVILSIIGGSALLISYYRIARTLPSVEDLRSRTSQFETTRILDRNGNPLYEILDPNAGRRTYVPLDKISPALLAATIATEDQDFYTH
ncbi:MAG TPA: hypothetical protein VLA72_03220, partial [Anaerolineales bacterium]|nr:hypothetical protein [Anaerolineales bacterium]